MHKLLAFTCFLLFTSFLFKVEKQEKISVILFTEFASTPLGITKDEFWNYRTSFDTIVIKSQKLCKLIKQKFKFFSKAEEIDMHHQAAFIYTNDNMQLDTIYADAFFIQWDINDVIYNDTTGYFRKMFRPWLDVQ